MTTITNNNNNNSNNNILDSWLKRRFMYEGFLHIKNGISLNKVYQCQRLFMHHLGIVGSIVPGGAQEGYGKLAGSLSNSLEVRDLLHDEKIMTIIEDLMGENNIDCLTNLSAQIALRFPELTRSNTPIQWHTDGLRQGKTHGFSLLVGVCLSDVTEENSGNLLIWPGTHVPIHQATIGNEGTIDIPLLESLLVQHNICSSSTTSTSTSITTNSTSIEQLNETQQPKEYHDNEPDNLPDLGQPYQLLANIGDVVILHPDTAHTGGPNYSPFIRSMVYFRLKHKNLKEHDELYHNNMWVDLPGVFSSNR